MNTNNSIVLMYTMVLQSEICVIGQVHFCAVHMKLPGIGCEFQDATNKLAPTLATCRVNHEVQN